MKKTLYAVARTKKNESWIIETHYNYEDAKKLLQSIETTLTEKIDNPFFLYKSISQEYFNNFGHQNFFAILKIHTQTEQERAKIRIKCERDIRKFLKEYNYKIVIDDHSQCNYNNQFIRKTRKALYELQRERCIDTLNAFKLLEILIKNL